MVNVRDGRYEILAVRIEDDDYDPEEYEERMRKWWDERIKHLTYWCGER